MFWIVLWGRKFIYFWNWYSIPIYLKKKPFVQIKTSSIVSFSFCARMSIPSTRIRRGRRSPLVCTYICPVGKPYRQQQCTLRSSHVCSCSILGPFHSCSPSLGGKKEIEGQFLPGPYFRPGLVFRQWLEAGRTPPVIKNCQYFYLGDFDFLQYLLHSDEWKYHFYNLL